MAVMISPYVASMIVAYKFTLALATETKNVFSPATRFSAVLVFIIRLVRSALWLVKIHPRSPKQF
ncbi:MAG: hypothetical protein EBY21_06560 [Alphaproteobacteria bacterium]|nr:hypothetical protein [Alphaproteobacteria bacterium]